MKTITIRTVKVLLTFDGAHERFRDVLESIHRAQRQKFNLLARNYLHYYLELSRIRVLCWINRKYIDNMFSTLAFLLSRNRFRIFRISLHVLRMQIKTRMKHAYTHAHAM